MSEDGNDSKLALVIDDSDMARKVLCRALGELGYDSVEATTGYEGLKRITEKGVENIKIIFLDVEMPKLDGLGFMKEARRIYQNNLPPVVVCSGESDMTVVKSIALHKINGYILKPVEVDKLDAKLSSVFSS